MNDTAIIIIIVLIIGAIWYIRRFIKSGMRRMGELGCSDYFVGAHGDGLPIAQRAIVTLYACSDRLVIDARKRSFELGYDRITNYSVVSDWELRQYHGIIVPGSVSSDSDKAKRTRFLAVQFLTPEGKSDFLLFQSNSMNIENTVSIFTQILKKSQSEK